MVSANTPHEISTLGNMGHLDNTLALAVETSGRKGSAAVGTGDQILAERILSGQLRHGAELLGCCSGLLQQVGSRASDIEHIYISAGPGSFTGIRIAVTMAKIMNFAAETKIISVSTMDVLAANAHQCPKAATGDIERIATVLDAKRRQFYVALFHRAQGRWLKSVDDCLMTSSEFVERFAGGDKTLWLLGEGLVYYADDFKADRIALLDESCWYPHARNVYLSAREKAKRGEFAEALALTPHYIRGPEAVPKPRP